MRNASPHHKGCGHRGEPRNGREGREERGGPGFGGHFRFGGPQGGREGGPHGGRFRRGPFEVEWSFEGGGRAGPGSPRGRRRLGSDELKFLLLKLIADQPRHGYDLIRAIEELTGGAYAPSAGMVYPTLSLLDEMGHIAAESEGARKTYAATEAGQAELAANAEQVAAIVARLSALGERQERADRSPVHRAMRNLKGVLVGRLSADDSGELAHQIAEILDEATRRIERL